VNAQFWKGKRVLITGFEGFLGSNLTRRMISCGARVVGIDILVNRKETILEKDDYKKISVFNDDVSHYGKIKRIVSRFQPEIVFHLAAEAIVGRCNTNPLRTFTSNIEGTWNVIEILRQESCAKAIVVASSDKAYGSHKILPYKEDASLSGNYPYDVSKSCADLIAYMYHKTYKLPVVVTRCGNIFGPGDYSFSRLVPDAIRCCLSNKTFSIRSDGKFTRDYVFIDDIIDGFITIAERLQKNKLSGNAFNFSYEDPLTVFDIVKKIYLLSNVKQNIKVLNEAKYEIKYQYLSSIKARKMLAWKPRYTLEQGLRKTIAWYKNILC